MIEKTVSIIVPVYNTGKYLKKCISSVLAQTYQKFEVVLINDASSDNSDELCKWYCNNDERFKYIQHKSNKGQTLSILEGLDLADGEWMMFLDSDDYLNTDALESMVNIAEKDNANIVLSAYQTFDDNGAVKLFAADIPDGCYKIEDFVGFLYDKIPISVLSCIGTKLYNMDFVKNTKPRTPDTLRTNYDIAFILDALTVTPTISYINKVTYLYYQRTDSITHKYRDNMYLNLTGSRAKLMPLLKACGCYDIKKLEYHLTMYSVISMSLSQEVEFEKGYNHFKEVFGVITNDSNSEETARVIIREDSGKKRKFLMFFIKQRCCLMTYLMYKIWLSSKK